MEKNDKKIKIFALFILSNICTFLLSSSETNNGLEITSPPIVRPDYVNIVIEAELKTEFDTSVPLVLSNKSRTLYIPTVFMKQKVSNDQNTVPEFASLPTSNHYLISINKKFVPHLLKSNKFEILPMIEKEILVKKQRNHTYEINI